MLRHEDGIILRHEVGMTCLTVFDHIKVLVELYRLGLLHETLHVMLVERQGRATCVCNLLGRVVAIGHLPSIHFC